MNSDHVDTALELSLNSCMWVDGLQNQVYLRIKEIPEMKKYLTYLDVFNDINDGSNEMKEFMEKLIELYETDITNQDFSCDEDHELWLFIQDNLLYDDDDKHIPIPVFFLCQANIGTKIYTSCIAFIGRI